MARATETLAATFEPDARASRDLVVDVVGTDQELHKLLRDYVARSPQATIYHDPEWVEIFAAGLDYRCSYLLARDRKTRACVGALPLYWVPSLVGRPRLVSIPFRDRGGPLWETSEAFVDLVGEAEKIARRVGARWVELKALRPYPEELIDVTGLERVDHWVHSFSRLGGLDEKGLLHEIGAKKRNQVRQAIRAGLDFSDATNRSDGADLWYALHLATQRNLGLPAFPKRFFDEMIGRLAGSDRLRLFVVEHEHFPVAACIVFLERRMGIYAYSASRVAGRRLRANDLLLFKVFLWLSENGFENFDLGTDSPSQPDLLAFKRKWLATQHTVPVYFSGGAGAPLHDSSALSYSFARRLVRYLPPSASRYGLSRLVKYFG